MVLRFSELCIDAADIHAQGQWWSAVLGWPAETTDDGDVALRAPSGADWLFLAVPEGKTIKNRLHIDLTPPGNNPTFVQYKLHIVNALIGNLRALLLERLSQHRQPVFQCLVRFKD